MILLYGAYGYTGTLIAERATALGVPLLLGGRDEARLRPLAERTGHPFRAFPLDAIDLTGVRVLLGAAGPFVHTAPKLVAACLAQGVHYVDITGEMPVFQHCYSRGVDAMSAGVALLPGAGFDVVPSDCIAKFAAEQLPGAERMKLSILSRGGASGGTARTATEAGLGGWVRRDGELVPAAIGSITGRTHFGDRERTTLAVPWADVLTAGWSTGIPNIEVHFAVAPGVARAARAASALGGLLETRLVGAVARAWAARLPDGPDAAARARGSAVFVAEVERGDERFRARLTTPEGYTLTAITALECAVRASRGRLRPGFSTPSQAFGADFITTFQGCVREALPV